ncbi:MAG: CHAT domain-containing tetratricopeptide repeat protein, partial [Acidobacteriota bacterium]
MFLRHLDRIRAFIAKDKSSFHNWLVIFISILILPHFLPILTTEAVLFPTPIQCDKNQAARIIPIQEGSSIEQESIGSDPHCYELKLLADQFLHLVVNQDGIDVVVTLYDPDGKELIKVDSPNGTQGPESFILMATKTDSYRLSISSSKPVADGRYTVTIKELRPASAMDRERAEAFLKAQKLFNEAFAAYETNEYSTSIDKYIESLPLWRIAANQYMEMITLCQIGQSYEGLKDKEKALEYFNQALPLQHALSEFTWEAITLNNIGQLYQDKGEKRVALEYYEKALPVAKAAQDPAMQTTILNNIAAIYVNLGEIQKALNNYRQALECLQATKKTKLKATVLNNMGNLYILLGDGEKALLYLEQSLPLRRLEKDLAAESKTLNHLAIAYQLLENYEKAKAYYNEAIALIKRLPIDKQEPQPINNIGKLYLSLGETTKAIDYFKQALSIQETRNDLYGQAYTLTNLGAAYNILGENEKASVFLQRALLLCKQLDNPDIDVKALFTMAKVERSVGRLTDALAKIRAAIVITESLRSKIYYDVLRTSYFATMEDHYEFYIDLLMQLHKLNPTLKYDEEALHISERARARSFIDLIAEGKIDINSGTSPMLLSQWDVLRQDLTNIVNRQIQLMQEKHTVEEMQLLQKETEKITAELQAVESQIRIENPRYAAINFPKPLTLKEIQEKVLDEKTLLLEYTLGEQRSYLWAITKNSMTSYQLPGRKVIEDVVARVYSLIAARACTIKHETREEKDERVKKADQELPKAIVELSQILLDPVASQLSDERLAIVADGALLSLPFEMLMLPTSNYNKYLLNDHEIVSLPSASSQAVLRQELAGRKPAEKTVAVIADPVLSNKDSRVNNKLVSPDIDKENIAYQAMQQTRNPDCYDELSFEPLPGSRIEAIEILKLVPKQQRFQALDFDANLATVTNPQLRQYRIIHFATHGFVPTKSPNLVGIALSLVNSRGEPQNGYLELSQIYNLDLPAELVTLSACDTGLGKEVQGEGIIGLVRGFM